MMAALLMAATLAAPTFSDDFEGPVLDESKWTDWVASFPGRSSGFLFARDNVSVSDGCLNLTARLMREDEKTVENTRQGFTTYATAYVRSRRKLFYGYYECRAKTMASKVCNAFWLYDPLSDEPKRKFRVGDFSEEIDMFEIFGSLRQWHGTVHCIKTPYLEGKVNGGVEKLPNRTAKVDLRFDPSADFHTYGFEWSAERLAWYIDGEEVFSRENDRYHRPLHVTFDCEIMYDWVGEPDRSRLPQTFSIDYFRHWAAADEALCYVGSLPGAANRAGLNVLSCNVRTGAARIVQTVENTEGTTYFQLSPDGRHLYSAIGEADADGRKRGVAVRFPIAADGRIGQLERLKELPSETPCHVSLSPDGSRYFAAAYSSGTAMSMTTSGGEFASYVFPDDAMGTNRKRQQAAFAHCTFMSPDAKRLGVVDLGCDRIRFFDPKTLAVDGAMEIRFEPGEGPRHAVWSGDGRFLFVVNELASSVASFAFDSAKRTFSRVDTHSTLPDGFNRWAEDGETLVTKAAAIKLTADGKLLMASNRGYDSIAFFGIDTETGRLTRRNIAKLTGKFPRDFELMPGERFMVVGHKMSDEIRIYRFDRAACTLTPVGDPISCHRPLCFKFR